VHHIANTSTLLWIEQNLQIPIAMKTYIYLILLSFPAVVCAQQGGQSVSTNMFWMDVGNAGFSAGDVSGTSLAFSPSGHPTVAYQDVANSQKATVMTFTGTSWEPIGLPGFTPSGVNGTSLAYSPNWEPYVAFSDFDQGEKASVMKFDFYNWVYVGSPGFSADIADYTSLAVTYGGVPYVAFADKGNGWKTSVMKFDGSNWVYVGSPGISGGDVLFVRLALDSNGVPYVAFSDLAYSQKASVMKFDGANWVTVGAPGFSAGAAQYLSLAIAPTGQPYVAYVDMAKAYAATVMKFDGSNWVSVGTPEFTPHAMLNTSLSFSPAGEPYLGGNEFIPGPLTYKAVVWKFNGTNWVTVGTPGFSKGGIDSPSLAFDAGGVPYLAFGDGGNSPEARVMKYDSLEVGIAEAAKPGVLLYPDPATTKLTIAITPTAGQTTYEITDTRGIILTGGQAYGNKITVDVTDYPPGMYFVRLKTGNSNFTGKFCKK
jgi:hypothetical protein